MAAAPGPERRLSHADRPLDFGGMGASSAIVDSTDADRTSVLTHARLRRLATALAIVAIAQAIGIVVLITALGDERFRLAPELPTIGFLASLVLFPMVGALIAQRRPATRVAWLMMVIGLGFGMALLTFLYGALGAPPREPLPLAREALVASQLFFVPVPAAVFAILLLLFPTDRLLSPRWKLVAIAGLAGAVLFAIGTVLLPGAIDRQTFPTIDNPFGAPAAWAGLVGFGVVAGNTMVTGAILLGAVSLVVRYRSADSVEAAQIRWIALVASIAALAFALSALQTGPLSDAAFGIGLVVLACMPIAIGIAITRYRLYDIDRLINRAIVYGTLTAILAGIFTAAIGLAQRLFVAVTGEASDVAIVLTTLVVATLYAPLRKRLEAIVDRRFKYDERRFGAYRDEVKQVLSILKPAHAAERLAREAVRELAARGGAVVDVDDQPTATSGEWPLPLVVRLPIRGGGRGLKAILIGPRLDGRPHDPRSIAELQELVNLVAAAARFGT